MANGVFSFVKNVKFDNEFVSFSSYVSKVRWRDLYAQENVPVVTLVFFFIWHSSERDKKERKKITTANAADALGSHK